MRALFVCPGLTLGGAERQWGALIPALCDQGFEPVVLAMNHEGPVADSLRQAGIDVHCATMRNRFDLARLRRALRRLPRDFDVVVTRSVNAHVAGGYFAGGIGAAHVATEHSQYDLLPLRRHQRALMRLAARKATAVVCVTPTQIDPLRRLGYPVERISVIPNAVPPHAVAPTRTRAEVLAELGVREDAFLAVMVAGLRPEKQPLDFVAAVERARHVDSRVHGVLVGDGELREAVDSACAASRGGVRAVGARADVGSFIHASDVVCLTSRHEASPLVLLEATAARRPVVATAVGGVPELVRHGQTGILVPPGDPEAFGNALATLAADSGFAARLREGVSAYAETQPTFDQMVDDYARLLRRAQPGVEHAFSQTELDASDLPREQVGA